MITTNVDSRSAMSTVGACSQPGTPRCSVLASRYALLKRARFPGIVHQPALGRLSPHLRARQTPLPRSRVPVLVPAPSCEANTVAAFSRPGTCPRTFVRGKQFRPTSIQSAMSGPFLSKPETISRRGLLKFRRLVWAKLLAVKNLPGSVPRAADFHFTFTRS